MAAASKPTKPCSVFAVASLALCVSLGGGGGCGAREQRTGSSDLAEPAEADAEAAHVVEVRGPGGISSPALPEGTFMGEGAKVASGQTIELPKGTLAELRLSEGGVVRANEGTALTMKKGDSPMRLERGEVVVLLLGHAPVSVTVGEDELTVHDGEVLARRGEEGNTFSVVTGRAELRRGGDTVSLGAGSKVSPGGITGRAPTEARDSDETGGAGPVAPVAKRSLDVLDDTRWSADFDAVAKKADLIPRGIGSLTARRAGSSVEHQPLRLVDQKVKVTIDGRLAHTEVEQAFHNDSGSVMEGIYRFPLPSDASISGLSLLVGRRWMEGEMLEKRRARQIFRQIVDATIPRDPALLQWEQGNVFKLNVFPIPARGERRIKIRYTQVLPESGEFVRYRYPMGGNGATGTPIEHFSFDVDVEGGTLTPREKAAIATPMMALARRIDGGEDGDVHLSATRDHYLPTWDLGVDVPVSARESGDVSVQTHLDKDGQAYFMATLRPSELPTPLPRPTSYAFVLDRSHGTAPELWSLSRAMVQTLLEGMEDGDDFTLLACDTACDAFSANAQSGSSKIVEDALRFVDGQTLAGASDLGQMMQSAARTLDARTGDRDRVIVYLGDGVPTSGLLTAEELGDAARHALGDARLLAVANGARADLSVLGHLSTITGGDLLRADPRDDVRSVVRELVLRAKVPAASDLELEVPAGMMDVHPKVVPALRSGDELTVVGRLTRPVDGEIRLRSRAQGGKVVQAFPVSAEARRDGDALHRHLPRTWAQSEIAHLTATQGADAREVIVALSRDYNVLSRWTALLVLENDAMYREFGVARKQDNKDGWAGEGHGGIADKENSGTEVYGGAPAAKSTPMPMPEAEPSPAGGDFDALDAPAERRTRAAEELAAAEQQSAFGDDLREEAEAEAEAEGDGWFASDEADGPDAASAASESVPGGVMAPTRNEPGLGRSSADAGEKKSKSSSRPSSKPAMRRPASADADMADPFEDAGGSLGTGSTGGSGGMGGGPYAPVYRQPRRQRVTEFRQGRAAAPTGDELAQVAALRRARDAAPTSRKAHERLVKQAIYTGHPQARSFAAAWAQSDPDHAPALLSHADLLAAAGEPIALRAYASAAEVDPFDSQQHRWLAQAFAAKGDWTRACSHRRALVSIAPSDDSRRDDLARCLDAAAGGAEQRGRLHANPDVRVELTWTGSADLDVVVVDRRGRRLSAMRPVGVRLRNDAGRGGDDHREELTLRRLNRSIHLEVTRADGGAATVRGDLKVTTRNGTRHYPVTIERGTLRIAKVSKHTHYEWR